MRLVAVVPRVVVEDVQREASAMAPSRVGGRLVRNRDASDRAKDLASSPLDLVRQEVKLAWTVL